MTTDQPAGGERRQFRRVLVRVLLVQIIALLVLWLLQTRYSPG